MSSDLYDISSCYHALVLSYIPIHQQRLPLSWAVIRNLSTQAWAWYGRFLYLMNGAFGALVNRYVRMKCARPQQYWLSTRLRNLHIKSGQCTKTGAYDNALWSAYMSMMFCIFRSNYPNMRVHAYRTHVSLTAADGPPECVGILKRNTALLYCWTVICLHKVHAWTAPGWQDLLLPFCSTAENLIERCWHIGSDYWTQKSVALPVTATWTGIRENALRHFIIGIAYELSG